MIALPLDATPARGNRRDTGLFFPTAAAFARDATMIAAILGFFAISWFGWAIEAPPPLWRIWLVLGMTASVALMAAGIFAAVRRWNDGTVFGASTSRTFGIIVGIEFSLAAIGALLLTFVFRRPQLIPPWIALVVGIHFLPLAAILEAPLLYAAGALVAVAAIASVPLAAASSITQNDGTGASTGIVLVATGLISLPGLEAQA